VHSVVDTTNTSASVSADRPAQGARLSSPLSSDVIAAIGDAASTVRTAARIAASETFQRAGFCESLSFAALFKGEVFKGIKACSCPVRAKKPNELVRVDINLNDFGENTLMLRQLLSMELQPFIIGVGQIATEDTPEGFVVLRCDDGQIHGSCHGLPRDIDDTTRTLEYLGRCLFERIEHLDPTIGLSSWENLTVRQRDFYKLALETVLAEEEAVI
jgi:hypothetical protein